MDPTRARAPEIADLATARALITTLQEQLAVVAAGSAWRCGISSTCSASGCSARSPSASIRGSCSSRWSSSPTSRAPSPSRSRWTRARRRCGTTRAGDRRDAGHCPRTCRAAGRDRRGGGGQDVRVRARAHAHRRDGHVEARVRAGQLRGHRDGRAPSTRARTATTASWKRPRPPQAVEKSLAGEGLLAHVVVSKYVDHLPLHRLEGIFAREGIDLSRTTLCDWVADGRDRAGADRRAAAPRDHRRGLSPNGRHERHRARRPGRQFQGAALDLSRSARPTGGLRRHRHARARRARGLARRLSRQAAGGRLCAATTGCIRRGHVIEIGCMAHARRRFVEAFTTDSAAALMVALIQQLYQVERGRRGSDAGRPPGPAAGARRRRCSRSSRPSAIGSPRPCCRNPRWATPCAISRISGTRCSASSTTAVSPSTTTAPRINCASSRSDARTGSSRAASRAPAAPRCSTRWSRAASSIDVPPFAYLKDVLLPIATHPQRPHRSAHAPRLGADLRRSPLRLIRSRRSLADSGGRPQDGVRRTLTAERQSTRHRDLPERVPNSSVA